MSGGIRLAGYLHLPDDRPGPYPCVVLCHGVSGTMDRLFPNARHFAAGGLAALVFDYRDFGESDGEPRQLVEIEGQQEDIRAAVSFARGHRDLDPARILLWGNSLGGAHVISVAAADPAIRAVVAQIPFNGFPRKVEGRSPWQTLRLQAVVLWDALRGRLGLPPHYIPMVGPPGALAVTATPEADEHIRILSGSGEKTLWRNEIAPRAFLPMSRYRPADAAPHLKMPLLICVAEDDKETPAAQTRPLAEKAPQAELRTYPGTHFGFYNDPTIRHQVLTDQLTFYRHHLAPEN
ncbi:alpha/beta hydrolase [Bailinhaonella thermotolerans]|uniref:Alpha/beta hydrolase n=1 Tax=Bailinhaonella thermotolerans TaxID=1070861 RepID=A0A3A4ASQ5_9ACTN|nr:alpha/beta hydrolase [Bailinhaonella thermotolerans]RJL32271.1 alpha/beta hydrolase [Bailinhaonella thermotolerans]